MYSTTIGESCSLHARIGWQGLTKSEYLDEGDYYLITGVDFDNRHIDFEKCHYVTKDRYDQDQHIQIHMNDVLVTKDGTIGKVAYIDKMPSKPATLNSGVFVVRPNDPTKLLPEYLKTVLMSNHFSRFIEQIKVGCTIAHLNQEKFLKYSFQLPTIEDQKHIINVYNTVIQLIKERKQQLRTFDTLIKARFIEMFGDPVANEKSWVTISLNDVCDGIGDGLHGTPEYDDHGEYPFINGNNLIDGTIEITPATKMVDEATYTNNYTEITDNAILISINGTLGKLAFYKGEKIMLGKSACYCNLKPSINREFVYGVMRSDAFAKFLEKNSTKSTIKNVGLKAMRGFQLIIPPDELQLQYIEFARRVDKSKAAIQQALAKSQLLFDSLMQKYFG